MASLLKPTAGPPRGQQPTIPPSLLHQLIPLVSAMRPHEWVKNGLLFAGILFSGRLFYPSSLIRVVVATAAFCFASSAIYLINDIIDIDRDRQHPKKSQRSLPSGKLTVPVAWWGAIASIMASGVLTIALLPLPINGSSVVGAPFSHVHTIPVLVSKYAIPGGGTTIFAITLLGYILLHIAYSVKLKHVVLLDVFAIAGGFVLRTVAGAAVIAVPISSWLYLCTVLLSLFLALNKRRQEVVLLGAHGQLHRPLLREYPLSLLDQLITIVTAGTIMAYSLYTFQSGSPGGERMMLTIPFVIYGIFRYLYLVQVQGSGGNPAEVLLHDRHIQASIAALLVIVMIVLYITPS